jgi:hypothetical protein
MANHTPPPNHYYKPKSPRIIGGFQKVAYICSADWRIAAKDSGHIEGVFQSP